MPLAKRSELVCAHDEVQLCAWVFRLHRAQRVDGEGWPSAFNFAVIHHHAWCTAKGQLRHGQTMLGSTQGSCFVPSPASRNNVQCIQRKCCASNLRQRDVRVVRRIKRAAKYADSFLLQGQIQSRLGKNSVVNRSSCEPGSTGRW